MKVISEEILEPCGDWVYGVTYFDDGSFTPWVRLKPEALIGQKYQFCYKNKKWKIVEKNVQRKKIVVNYNIHTNLTVEEANKLIRGTA